jgi:DNA primase catalytic core
MFLSRNLLEKIKKNLSIIEVINKYLNLTKFGNKYYSLCPFHNSKHPSFYVSEEKKIFRCFVCTKKGDVFNFLRYFKKISFFEAVKQLAKEAGFEKEIENLINEKQNTPPNLSKKLKAKGMRVIQHGEKSLIIGCSHKRCILKRKLFGKEIICIRNYR